MVPESRTTTVKILGHEYKIRSSESPEAVQEVALYVDEVMSSISSRMSTVTTAQAAVLAALNIAEDLFRERREGRNGNGETDERLRALVLRLDEVTATDGAPRKGGRPVARAGSRG
jgi:cell division protein ZapA